MLISEIMEETPPMTAAENMANRLADHIRNIWLDNTQMGVDQWEVNFYEDADGVSFLRGEDFPDLQGIDYMFQWWGHEDSDGLAGRLDVLWKVNRNGNISIYKTSIRFAPRDFILGAQSERKKREINRAEFRRAFAVWRELYQNRVGTAIERTPVPEQ